MLGPEKGACIPEVTGCVSYRLSEFFLTRPEDIYKYLFELAEYHEWQSTMSPM